MEQDTSKWDVRCEFDTSARLNVTPSFDWHRERRQTGAVRNTLRWIKFRLTQKGMSFDRSSCFAGPEVIGELMSTLHWKRQQYQCNNHGSEPPNPRYNLTRASM